MEIAAPQLLRESAASADPVRMTRDEEIADASFRAADFASLDREHLSVQGCLFTGCLFAGSVLARSQFSDVVFRNCDFSNADLLGCSLHRVRFADCKLWERISPKPRSTPAVRTLQGRVRQFRLFAAAHGAFCGLSDAWRRFRGLPFRTCRVCAVRPDTGRILRHPPARTFFRRFGHPRHSRSRDRVV